MHKLNFKWLLKAIELEAGYQIYIKFHSDLVILRIIDYASATREEYLEEINQGG